MSQKHQHGLVGKSIERPNEKLVLLLFTMEAERPHTAKEEALRLIYTEALLAGAGEASRAQFLDSLSTLGSSITVSPSAQMIHFSLQAISTTRKATLSLFETMLKKPRFDEREIARIKTHLTNLLTLAEEDARSRAFQNFNTTLTTVEDPHYTHELAELIRTLKSCTRKDLIALHNACMEGKWTYTAGGDVESTSEIERVLQRLRKVYTHKEERVLKTYETKPITKPTLKLKDIPSKHNIEFSIGSNLPLTQKDPQYLAFLFGISVLAITGGFAGRLMSIVREKEGLTYMIYGQLERLTATQSGFWRITTFFNPKDTVSGITSTLREIRRIKTSGITDDELVRFKAILATRFIMTRDSLFKRVRQAHTGMLSGMTEEEITQLQSNIQKLTKDAVNSALRRFINIDQIVVSGAGPIKTVEKELAELITKGKRTGK